jgi:hypothetical protein
MTEIGDISWSLASMLLDVWPWLGDSSTWSELVIALDWTTPCAAVISSLSTGIAASGGRRLTTSTGATLGFREESE